jgi:hypothetical protein
LFHLLRKTASPNLQSGSGLIRLEVYAKQTFALRAALSKKNGTAPQFPAAAVINPWQRAGNRSLAILFVSRGRPNPSQGEIRVLRRKATATPKAETQSNVMLDH